MFRSLLLCFFVSITTLAASESNEFLELARSRDGDLRLSVYATAGAVVKMAESQSARDEALVAMSQLGITKIYVEVYRSGRVVRPDQLVIVRDFFRNNGVGVAGGIATVPGEGFGVAANEGLGWFNFQAPETRQGLEQVVRDSAPLFDTFIIDDFLCTGDTSEISNAARSDRTWSQYRRDLMVDVAQNVFIKPAKEVNPGIEMIIKYPQWYDLFHEFGYDVAREPALFDGVWVGTETRGSMTQRYGFVQPYEGFINYRWIAAQSGGKIRGAWFDYGDCGDFDFIDQAWQSVAAGAPELMIFSLGDVIKGHPDHKRLQEDFTALADLARFVRDNPVVGPVGYKPPNSDAGGDLYIMDFIGMLGVSLVPSPEFPADAATIFLATQAAADPDIAQKVEAALEAGRRIVMTAGFLASAPNPEQMAKLAGLKGPVSLQPLKADKVMVLTLSGPSVPRPEEVEPALDLAADLQVETASPVLWAVVDGREVPFWTEQNAGDGKVFVLNARTFSREDFAAVNEVLLSPRLLGLLNIPMDWCEVIRAAMTTSVGYLRVSVPRVTCQQLGEAGWLIQNYLNSPVEATMMSVYPLENALTGEPITKDIRGHQVKLPSRGRLWVKMVQPTRYPVRNSGR